MKEEENKVEEPTADVVAAMGAGVEIPTGEPKEEARVVPMNGCMQPKKDPKYYIKPLTMEEAKKGKYLVEIPRGAVTEVMKTLKYLANNVSDSSSGGRWGNFITKNARKLSSIEMETNSILRANYPAPEKNPRINEYGDKEFELITAYSQKDINGNPVLDQKTNQFQIEPSKDKEYNEKMMTLRTEYDDVMKIYEEVNMKANTVRQMRVDFEPHLILQSNLPVGLLPVHYKILDPFIIED